MPWVPFPLSSGKTTFSLHTYKRCNNYSLWYVCDRLIYHVSHLIHFVRNSWHHRCYPTLSHKVWETWTSDELNKFLEVYFEFPFKMIDQSNYAFLTGQSWQVLQSCHTAGAQNKDFGPCSQMDLTRAQLLEGRLALNPWLI